MKYPNLLQPLRLGSITLKNRLVMAQMTMNYATEEGFATERLVRHYLERARGGVGLIFVEGTFFTAEGRGYRNQLGLTSDRHAEKLQKLTDAVHGLKNGVKIFLQIHHAGARASSKVTGLQPVAPSALPPYPGAEIPHALTREEIKGLVQAHVDAAARAKEARFDGVDIHCAHGYLVPGFLSPLSNVRTDEYGGDLSGRTRFLMEIIGGIKKLLGRDFPLTIKVSGDEYIEGGLDTEKMIEIALLGQEAGLDGITCSAGTVGGKKIEDLSQAHKVLRTMPMMTDHGCLVPIAARMKKALKIPVITVGRINHPALAEEVVAQGKADLVAMGRALLADPFLPVKAFEEREEEIRPCMGCNEGCYKRILQQQEIRCSVNPRVGREGEVSSGQADRSKKVFILGGGPAGLEAANAAHERGHQVVLMEKEKELGGQLRLASIPPGRKEIEGFREFLLKRLRRTGVKVITGKTSISSYLKRNRPDVLIVAAGSKPKTFDIPGLEESRTLTAWDVLYGKRVKPPCLVLGAGLVGCETADFIAQQGKDVFLVEVLPEMGAGSDGDTKAYFNLRFQQHGVKVYTSTELHRVEGKTAILRHGKDEMRIEIGTVVFAVGAVPEGGGSEEYASSVPVVIRVGDCVRPRNILESVREGFDAGRSI